MKISGWLRFWRQMAAILIPLLLLPLPLFVGGSESKCAWMVLVMAIFWALEILPLAATAIIPIIFLPLLGIVSTGDICVVYMKSSCVMLIGGLIVAIAVEHSNLHRRIALTIVSALGTSPRFLTMGFMIPTAFLSMWISNTATTGMMIPVMETVLEELDASANIRNMMMLSVAYAANIGGTGTLIGTAPNLVLQEQMLECAGQPLGFGSWMGLSIPTVVINIILAWTWLQVVFLPLTSLCRRDKDTTAKAKEDNVKQLLMQKKRELGKMSLYESLVLAIFIILVFVWLFRSPGFIKGWSQISSDDLEFVGDATPVVLAAVILLAMPLKDGKPFLPWELVEKKLPWGLILLIGGGFALGEGLDKSGLKVWIGEQLASLEHWNPLLLLLLVTTMVTFITEFMSNTATANMLLPVLFEMSVQLKRNPLYLMLAATLACSYAFMFPVSTPPNALVYKASGMKSTTMMKAGFGMNIIMILSTVGVIHSLGMAMFDLDGEPDWFVQCINSTHIDPSVM